MNSVLFDTSFLISFTDPTRAHHKAAVSYYRECVRSMQRDAGDDRARVKDDFKILAQCDCEAISHLITEDSSTLAKYVDRARDSQCIFAFDN